MTPRPEGHVRPLLGAFVLGHLDSHEAAGVRAHLDGCAACRAEAADLTPVAGLLPLADPGRVGVPAEPPRQMLDQVLTRIERERDQRDRTRRRSVSARVAAVAAVLALSVVVSQLVWQPSEAPGGQVVALTAAEPGLVGEAVIHDDPRSTWVELNASGLSTGETYAVWFEETGTRERSALGTFIGVEGDLYISLYSTLPRARVASIGVSGEDGGTVMQAEVPDPVPA